MPCMFCSQFCIFRFCDLRLYVSVTVIIRRSFTRPAGRGCVGTYYGRETVGTRICFWGQQRCNSDERLQVKRAVALRVWHRPDRRRHRGKKFQRECECESELDSEPHNDFRLGRNPKRLPKRSKAQGPKPQSSSEAHCPTLNTWARIVSWRAVWAEVANSPWTATYPLPAS